MAPCAILDPLLGGRLLASSHLLGLEILIKEEKSRLIGLGRAHDGEHALARIVMRSLQRTWLASQPMLCLATLPAPSMLTLAIEMRAPDVLRISLILLPARPMMHPTMSAGMLMFWV